MSSTISTFYSYKCTETANSSLSPIIFEEIRDQQRKELQKQRTKMSEHEKKLQDDVATKSSRIGVLHCYLASKTEERKYLENKLMEIQARQKEEMRVLTQQLKPTCTPVQEN